MHSAHRYFMIFSIVFGRSVSANE